MLVAMVADIVFAQSQTDRMKTTASRLLSATTAKHSKHLIGWKLCPMTPPGMITCLA